MRIAVDLTSLADNFSGIERYAANIALNLIRNDRDNRYILQFKDGVHELFLDAELLGNAEVIVIPSNGLGKLVFSQLLLPARLRKLDADLNVFLAFPSPLLFFGPSISTIHDLSCWDCPETMTGKSRLLWRALDKKAASSEYGVLTISEFSRSRIVDHYRLPKEKVSVVYCGIDYEKFNVGLITENELIRVRAKYHLPQTFLLSLSTIEPRKNLAALINAWVSLSVDTVISDDLVLAGRKGWKTEAILQSIPESLHDRVHFTGFVDDDDLPALYTLADLFVFPSIYEGFGLPPIEAVSCGARVLCSDIPCHKEICGDSAFYFSLSDPNSLADSIKKLLIDNPGCQSRKTTVRSFDWPSESRKLVNLIESSRSKNA